MDGIRDKRSAGHLFGRVDAEREGITLACGEICLASVTIRPVEVRFSDMRSTIDFVDLGAMCRILETHIALLPYPSVSLYAAPRVNLSLQVGLQS